VVFCYQDVFATVTVYAIVHRLLCVKPSENQSKIFLIKNWQLAQSTQGSFGILEDWLSFEIPYTHGAKRKCAKVCDLNMVWPLRSFGDAIRIDIYTIGIYGLDESSIPWVLTQCWKCMRKEILRQTREMWVSVWGSVLLGSCNEQKRTCSQLVKARTQNHTCA